MSPLLHSAPLPSKERGARASNRAQAILREVPSTGLVVEFNAPVTRHECRAYDPPAAEKSHEWDCRSLFPRQNLHDGCLAGVKLAFGDVSHERGSMLDLEAMQFA
jgi:hypothetical protein